MSIEHKWMNNSLTVIFNKINLIFGFFIKIWNSEIVKPKLGSQTLIVFLVLWQDINKYLSIKSKILLSITIWIYFFSSLLNSNFAHFGKLANVVHPQHLVDLQKPDPDRFNFKNGDTYVKEVFWSDDWKGEK